MFSFPLTLLPSNQWFFFPVLVVLPCPKSHINEILQYVTFLIWLLSLSIILWPPHVKSWLIGKDSDAGRDWGLEEKGTTEDEMAGWHHWLDGHEFEWIPGVGDGQGGLACCNSQGRKESDTTQLNWTELNTFQIYPCIRFFFFFLLLSFLLSFHSIHSMHFHSVFIHSPDDVNFCYFLVLMIMTENKFSINIHIEIFV